MQVSGSSNERETDSPRSIIAGKSGHCSAAPRTPEVCTLFSLILVRFRLLALIFSPFFSTTTTFHLLLLVIYYFPSIPVDCMRPTRDIRSPYVHASRARLNTCTSSTFVCTSREPSLPRLRRSVPPPVFSHFFLLLPSFC